MSFNIANFKISPNNPVLFIADIASNHCGELSLAKELIHACAESGVNAIKMQNFAAATIVSDYGFKNLQGIKTHQNKWRKSVFDSYDDASIPLSWTGELRTLCDHLGMAYLTSPYSIELVEEVADNVCAFKLGSGDITWHDEIRAMASHDKPILIATGASTMLEVEQAMDAALSTTNEIVLMQCNTEYTANVNESDEQKNDRYKHINLRVLETYRQRWPGVPLGLSDHTHGDLTVLGAVGLFDCCVVEKHFTLDNSKEGQDHAFSMTPESWKEMANNVKSLQESLIANEANSFDQRMQVVKDFVDNHAALELALGDGIKRLENNEQNTVVVQRRALRATRDLPAGSTLTERDLIPLRPCPQGAIEPYKLPQIVGQTLVRPIPAGAHLGESDLK